MVIFLYVDKVKLLGSDNLFVSEESNSVYSVYPNPCQDQITISNFKPGDLVNIYSMDGKLLASSNEPVVNVSSLNAGTYLIKIVSEEGIYTAAVYQTVIISGSRLGKKIQAIPLPFIRQ